MLAALHALVTVVLPLALMAVFKVNILKTAAVTLGYVLLAVISLGYLDVAPDLLVKGCSTGLKIAAIVFSALLYYNMYRELGYEASLKEAFRGGERGGTLPIAVFFSGFIESVSGFGITVAVTAPMLVMLGIAPLIALAASLIGHSWSVPYASIGIPTMVLASITERDVFTLSQYTGIYMFVPLVVTVIVVGHLLELSLKEVLPALALTLLLPITSTLLGPLAGSVASLTCFIAYVSLVVRVQLGRVVRALSPYLVLSGALILLNLAGLGNIVNVSVTICALGLAYHLAHRGNVVELVRHTLVKTWKPGLAIVLFTSIAEVSRGTGLMWELAKTIADVAGLSFVYLVPVIGAIGTYVTGSNTASNIIFAALQESYAEIVGYNPIVVLSLQNCGGGLGSMIAPSKIAVGASTLSGEKLESEALRITIRYVLIVVLPLILAPLLLV
mgnify:CR=1 FL=1